MGRRVRLIVRIAVGIVILALVLQSVDFAAAIRLFASIRIGPLLALCVLQVARRVLMAYKSNILLRARSIRISLLEAVRIYYVGYSLGAMTPGAIGADVYKVAALQRFRKADVIVSTIILERLIGLAVISGVALATIPWSTNYLAKVSPAAIGLIVAIAPIASLVVVVSLSPSILEGLSRRLPFLFRKRMGQRLRQFYLSYLEASQYPRAILIFVMLTAFELFVLIIINYLAAQALAIDVSLLYFVCVLPLLHILLRLPISIQGLGVQEGMFAFFLIAAGYTATDGVAISFLLRVVEVVLGIVPGAILLWAARHHKPFLSGAR